ncbi:MAG: leucine-rich repeat protein, partial [Solobacterium sp.]|nr:leucine-rich repeat protein [Solobacterium sp.]
MKRVICCILTSVFILLTGMGQTGISVKAETLSEEQDWYEKNVFIRSADSSNAEVTGMIFSTEFFTGDNQVLNQEIAKCSVGLAGAVYEFNYIDTILNDLGFSYDDYKEEAATRYGNWNRSHSAGDNDFVRYIIATKEFVHNGENYILYCVPIQGTNGSFDWTSNVNIGETDNHEGFYTAHEEIMDDLFVRMMNDGYEAGKRIVWVTGHSRGAAVANIVAGELTGGIDDMSSKIYSGLVQSDHVYGYTFACPNVSKDTRVKNSGYMNIYNFNNPDDIVPSVPLDDWGYGRYGQTIDLSSLTREIVDMRYQQEYERSYRGNDHFATILNEEIAPRLIGNSGDANDVYMKAFLNGFAYLMQRQHDFRGFLEAAGFFAKDNFWALIMKQIEKLNPFDSLISYLNKIGFLATRVAEYASATENMTEEEFAVWLEEHRTEVDEIESAFEYNIKSNFDLKSLYILVESDLFFEIQGIRLNATLTENLITILGDVFAYWVGMDGDLAVADIVADAHAPATYAYWINAMYFGYKGYYGYNKDRTITAAAAEDDQILTIGTSCFENASNVKSLVLRSQAKYIGNNACKSVSSLEKLVLPETLVHIGNYAFYNCSSAPLANLQFAPGLKTIGNYSFYGCTGITGTLTIPDTVESIGVRAFNNDSGITEVIMPVSRISDGYEVTNTNGYYDYFGAFTGCSGITKVKLTGSGDMPEVRKEASSRFDVYYDKGTITPGGAAEYAGN